MSFDCQGMVPAALKLCPAPGKMSWQHRRGWEWDCDSAEVCPPSQTRWWSQGTCVGEGLLSPNTAQGCERAPGVLGWW